MDVQKEIEMSVTGTSNDYQASLTQIGQFFSQLGQDLQAVKPSDAQSFFAQLEQSLQAVQGTQPQSSSPAGNAGGIQNPINSDLSTLGQDLQSGNLTDAQSVFAQLQQDIQATQNNQNCCDHDSDGRQGSLMGSINSDLSSLGQALQSNSTTDAQSALAQRQQDIQALQGHHHHHHHHFEDDDDSGASQISGSQGTGMSTINSDLSALGQALQSNSITGAQSALAQLQQDIQAMQGQNAQGVPSTAAATGASQASASQGTGPHTITGDLSALGQAIQSNNSTNMQSAFTQLQQDVQTAQSLYAQISSLMSIPSLATAPAGGVNVSVTA
jgi:hypothetical protein